MHEIESFGQKKKAEINVESKTQNAQQSEGGKRKGFWGWDGVGGMGGGFGPG